MIHRGRLVVDEKSSVHMMQFVGSGPSITNFGVDDIVSVVLDDPIDRFCDVDEAVCDSSLVFLNM